MKRAYDTKILQPTKENIALAAKTILAGGLVGMPTETVYGLAANAMDQKAVSKIFAVKGRPQDNPLIVHINSLSMMDNIVKEIPPVAQNLMELYWHGPLTLVLEKADTIPLVVSAGLATVAVRFPSHATARKLINACGCPIAAPSANLSGSPSPTSAKHVFDDLQGRIPYILDGGDCSHGVESTVVYVNGNEIQLLRPGSITIEQLEKSGRIVTVSSGVEKELEDDETVNSPGMKYKHYSPKAEIIVLDGDLKQFITFVKTHSEDGMYAMVFEGEEKNMQCPAITYGNIDDSQAQAHNLFSALRKLDELQAKKVYVRCPNKDGVGLAVYNRLLRSAGFSVIKL